MPSLPVRSHSLACLVLVALSAAVSPAAATPPAPQSVPVLTIGGLGKGLAPLDGPWQFHLGDDAAWAQPGTSDATGTNGWEQLSTDKTWGAQGHPAYVGYGWYRKHVQLEAAPGVAPDFALMMPRVDWFEAVALLPLSYLPDDWEGFRPNGWIRTNAEQGSNSLFIKDFDSCAFKLWERKWLSTGRIAEAKTE